MARDHDFMLCVTLLKATGLENKQGRRPTVAFVITRNRELRVCVLSEPAKDGGENPSWWNLDEYRLLCDEPATLKMILFYKGSKYDTILGEVREFLVSELKPGSHKRPVLKDKSGTHGGGFLEFSVRVVPTLRRPQSELRSFTVNVHLAKGLENVKPLWKRISLKSLCVRKMKPFLVVESNYANEPMWVSPIAGEDGTDPEFNFKREFTCKESLIQKNELSVTFELHHRHKAERYRDSSDQVRAGDIKIGTVKVMIKVSENDRPNEWYYVHSPKQKYVGKLYVSVALGELKQQEQEILTPSSTSTSWRPRLRPQANGYFGVRKFVGWTLKCVGPVSVVTSVAFAAAAA